ncbi:hypothetical protein C8R46DRAFT_1030695 [Mycena filopes]|nr:hypothetical protein C8R46DRAFT_1030695 [Mycena filopes]
MSGRISVYGFPFVGKLVFFPVLIAVSSFLFVPVQPLHRDKEAFNDDWNEFNDLRYSANKFRPSTPHPTRLLGRISVRFPLFYRDMEALKDDWNDFNDLGHSANKFGASHPLVRSNIRSVSCSSLFYRDMDAFNDDWNDFNDLDHSATRTLPMPTRGPASFSFKDVKLGKKLPLDVVPPLSGVTAHPSTLPAAPFSGTITSHKGANGTFASQSHSHLAAGLSGFATRVLLIRMYRPVCNGEVGPQVVVAVDERNAGGGCVVDLAATSGKDLSYIHGLPRHGLESAENPRTTRRNPHAISWFPGPPCDSEFPSPLHREHSRIVTLQVFTRRRSTSPKFAPQGKHPTAARSGSTTPSRSWRGARHRPRTRASCPCCPSFLLAGCAHRRPVVVHHATESYSRTCHLPECSNFRSLQVEPFKAPWFLETLTVSVSRLDGCCSSDRGPPHAASPLSPLFIIGAFSMSSCVPSYTPSPQVASQTSALFIVGDIERGVMLIGIYIFPEGLVIPYILSASSLPSYAPPPCAAGPPLWWFVVGDLPPGGCTFACTPFPRPLVYRPMHSIREPLPQCCRCSSPVTSSAGYDVPRWPYYDFPRVPCQLPRSALVWRRRCRSCAWIDPQQKMSFASRLLHMVHHPASVRRSAGVVVVDVAARTTYKFASTHWQVFQATPACVNRAPFLRLVVQRPPRG